ncbi:MAG: protein translocase subunit SecD [Gammaproteobacteria bacterium]|nr:protein translocase subunit SecD [Gammaproteobacteria bacterium]
MLNQYPWWKYLLIVIVLLVGAFFASPNIFGNAPAVQVSANQRGVVVDESLRTQVADILKAKGHDTRDVLLEGGRVIARFQDPEVQLAARDAVQESLGPAYAVALDLAPGAPSWLTDAGALPMYLGLDLRGGIHFLMEVDMAAAVTQAEERFRGDIRTGLREERLRYKTINRPRSGGIMVSFRDDDTRQKAIDVIRRQAPELQVSEEENGEEFVLRLGLNEPAREEIRSFALQQNITTLRKRVNELGVAEPVIQQQGNSRIVVQLPGVQDPAKAKIILGKTATLEFRMVDEDSSLENAVAGRIPAASKLYRDRQGLPVLLKKRVLLTGDYIVNAASGIDQLSGSPAVYIDLDGRGARIMSDGTRDNIGRMMAVVFIEQKTETKTVDGEAKRHTEVIEEVINQATIRDQLGARFQITGLDSTEEARDLALLLRAGALAAPIEIVEERTVGPSLGKANIEQGFRSVIIGFVLVLIFMAIYYRVFGLIADLALALNLVLVVAFLSLFQATLTLPGIAGIVLTVGMAVDANVLIFERIREELRNGNTPQASIHAGYEKAFLTILDANVTTLIAAIVLFGFGTGPIKGFAITLAVGIVTSMFTAIIGTRALVNLIYGGRKRVAALSI